MSKIYQILLGSIRLIFGTTKSAEIQQFSGVKNKINLFGAFYDCNPSAVFGGGGGFYISPNYFIDKI